MNTQIESTSPVAGISTTVPTAPAGETYADYPSQHITGMPDSNAHSLDPYTVTDLDMRCIFEELRDMVEHDSRGDIDGEQYDLDFKAYRIEAVHHYQCHEERGGDSYCGVCESYGVIDVDRIQVVRVFDEDGKEYPALVARLNEYALRV